MFRKTLSTLLVAVLLSACSSPVAETTEPTPPLSPAEIEPAPEPTTADPTPEAEQEPAPEPVEEPAAPEPVEEPDFTDTDQLNLTIIRSSNDRLAAIDDAGLRDLADSLCADFDSGEYTSLPEAVTVWEYVEGFDLESAALFVVSAVQWRCPEHDK